MGRIIGWLGVLSVALLVLNGCPARVQSYSPRLHDSPEHQQAMKQKNCQECHQVEKVRNHSTGDDCVKCHFICRGC